jgi:hypothetical protein
MRSSNGWRVASGGVAFQNGNRSHVNRVLNRKRRDMDGAIIKALGLRKVYIAEEGSD